MRAGEPRMGPRMIDRVRDALRLQYPEALSTEELRLRYGDSAVARLREIVKLGEAERVRVGLVRWSPRG